MSKIYNNYTFQVLTDKKTRDLLDKYVPGIDKVPLSVVLDQALSSGGSLPVHVGTTWFVDLAADAGGDGSVAQPFNSLDDANAASGDLDTISFVGAGTLTAPTFVANRFYHFNRLYYTLDGEVTFSGTGTIFVEGLIADISISNPFCTISTSQQATFVDCIFTLNSNQTFFLLNDSTAILALQRTAINNAGNGPLVVTLDGQATIDAQCDLTTQDGSCVAALGGVIDVKCRMTATTDVGYTAFVDNTGILISRGLIRNLGLGTAVEVIGATSTFEQLPGSYLSTAGVALINKTNPGSTWKVVPQASGAFGTVAGTGGSIDISRTGGGYLYYAGNPDSVVYGALGQIIAVPGAPGFPATFYLCLGGLSWQDIS